MPGAADRGSSQHLPSAERNTWVARARHACGVCCARRGRTSQAAVEVSARADKVTASAPLLQRATQGAVSAKPRRLAAGVRGQTSCRQAGAGADSPGSRRDSVALVMLVAGRGRCQRARSARHRHACGRGLEGDAGGGQSRAVPGEVVRRSRAQQAARVRGGRRAEGRARRTSGTCAFKAWTRDRLKWERCSRDGRMRLIIASYYGFTCMR